MNKRRLSFAAVAILVMMMATSCSIYQPRVVDIPLIDHAGDTRLDVNAGMGALMTPSLGLTFSRGINDWLSGQAHLSTGFNHVYFQLAPGAYKKVGEKMVLEGFAGVGLAAYDAEPTDMTDDQDTSFHYYFTYMGSYVLPFVQGNIGWKGLARGHIDLAFSLKAGLYYPSFDYHEFLPDDTPILAHEFHYGHSNVLLEPQFQLRIGGEKLKYCFRVGMCWLSHIMQHPNNYLASDFLTISHGVTFNF